ncbi:hypothetical protein AMECASPLE_013015 [Ameca splendens]|uniref:Uncharacterized protein n=1 Tax=Ameca splendens TaxID=208324 RepID=A0ABV0YNJ7_9TELE
MQSTMNSVLCQPLLDTVHVWFYFSKGVGLLTLLLTQTVTNVEWDHDILLLPKFQRNVLSCWSKIDNEVGSRSHYLKFLSVARNNSQILTPLTTCGQFFKVEG